MERCILTLITFSHLYSFSQPPPPMPTTYGSHSAEELAALGLLTFTASSGEASRTYSKGSEASSTGKAEAHTGSAETSTLSLQQSLVPLGPGLPALPKKLVDRIRGQEYIDFAELPPAKGKNRPPPQTTEGQIVVLQAADLAPTHRTIPDLATWLQCCGIYVAVVAQRQPEQVPDLMAYQSIIAKSSLKYKWPSWVVYDSSFQQEMAGSPGQSWARVDPSIYSLCFFGQNVTGENWCTLCQSLDHTSQTCPT